MQNRYLRLLLNYSVLQFLFFVLIVIGLLSNRVDWLPPNTFFKNTLLIVGATGIYWIEYLKLQTDKERINFLIQKVIILLLLLVLFGMKAFAG